MKKTLNCIMLIDDNPDDNFFHKRVILKNGFAKKVIEIEYAQEALDFLANKIDHPEEHPNLIFLDINMPGMSGWEFMEKYEQLDEKFHSKLVVIMLTTSQYPKDREKAKSFKSLSDFYTKPLTKEVLQEIIDKNF